MEEKLTKCPYSDICKCPGYDPDRPRIPSRFKQVPDGILCLNWDVVITHDQLSQLIKREGRHIAGAESADKIETAWKKYSKSKKRKAAQVKYRESHPEVDKKYFDSEKAKLAYHKYYYSEKGQKAARKGRDKVKLFKEAQKWLKEHPGKTFDDFLMGGFHF